MHKRNSIVSLPLLVGIVLSVAIHVAALYGKGIYTPPKPSLKQGRTVVQLTLLPSIASKGNPKPESLNPIPVPQAPTSQPEPTPVPQAPRLPDPKPQTPTANTSSPKNSPDQDASLIEEKGVISEALPTEGISATYPRLSQRRGEEGTVLLSIEVLANGRAGKVQIKKTSGHRRLDEAAVKAARKTTYTPAKQFGRNVDSILIQPLTFELTNHD